MHLFRARFIRFEVSGLEELCFRFLKNTLLDGESEVFVFVDLMSPCLPVPAREQESENRESGKQRRASGT